MISPYKSLLCSAGERESRSVCRQMLFANKDFARVFMQTSKTQTPRLRRPETRQARLSTNPTWLSVWGTHFSSNESNVLHTASLKTTLSRDHEAQPRDKLSDGEVELAKEKVCDLRSMEQNLAVTQEASHLCCVPSNVMPCIMSTSSFVGRSSSYLHLWNEQTQVWAVADQRYLAALEQRP